MLIFHQTQGQWIYLYCYRFYMYLVNHSVTCKLEHALHRTCMYFYQVYTFLSTLKILYYNKTNKSRNTATNRWYWKFCKIVKKNTNDASKGKSSHPARSHWKKEKTIKPCLTCGPIELTCRNSPMSTWALRLRSTSLRMSCNWSSVTFSPVCYND